MKKPLFTQEVYKVASQFLRRKKKAEEESKKTEVVVEESSVESSQEPIVEVAPTVNEVVQEVAKTATEVTYTNVAYDIFEDQTDKRYKAVVIKYNPELKLAVIEDIVPVTRTVGMSYVAQKTALKTIIKK